ncbi:unnamed protein product [Arabidopsis thaliana]|uniref:RBR-type E3 ubiquitin transferase n=1 Tax=Arabidopsis thaliana TaxID=3702 RepID=A0A654FD25_ARATH|nr:unnamed protein product [Arabidopsis thaliana]
MKGPIHHDSNITPLEAELTALKRGLTEAVNLGITHISIYCDDYPIYKFVMGRCVPEENKTALLMIDVQRIREGFNISVNPPRQPKATRKTTCKICLDDDINENQMFCVGKCRHRFCSDCMRRHIEVRLLEGSVMRCPHYRCKTTLKFGGWRIYCPNPRCSALMSETELSISTKEDEVRRCCIKCGQIFCIKCKVSWHSNLSCNDYKKLNPYPTENDGKIKALANQKRWRQCGKCQHMIELSKGCVQVKCRCGHKFCYRCGVQAGGCKHGHGFPPRPPPPPPSPPPTPNAK